MTQHVEPLNGASFKNGPIKAKIQRVEMFYSDINDKSLCSIQDVYDPQMVTLSYTHSTDDIWGDDIWGLETNDGWIVNQGFQQVSSNYDRSKSHIKVGQILYLRHGEPTQDNEHVFYIIEFM